jgi:hypothetical protein
MANDRAALGFLAGATVLPNKRMKLTKLSAAPFRGRRCRLMPAPARSDAGTASQLIRGVRWAPDAPRGRGRNGLFVSWSMLSAHAERGLAPGRSARSVTWRRGARHGARTGWHPGVALGGSVLAPARSARERGVLVRSGGKRHRRATERALEADEAPLELERGMVVGVHLDSAVAAWVPACSGASQLKRGVRWTHW